VHRAPPIRRLLHGIGRKLTFRKYSSKAVIGGDATVASLSKIINAAAGRMFHCKKINRLWQPFTEKRPTPFSRKNFGPHTAQ